MNKQIVFGFVLATILLIATKATDAQQIDVFLSPISPIHSAEPTTGTQPLMRFNHIFSVSINNNSSTPYHKKQVVIIKPVNTVSQPNKWGLKTKR